MNKVLIIILLLATILEANAQDNKKVDLYLMVGLAPMYTLSSDNIDYFDGPLSGSIQIYYNINSHISAGIHTQGAYFVGAYTETLFGNFGLSGKYILNPNSRFKLYGGLILGQTLVKENSDQNQLFSEAANSDELTEILTYDESKFTVGLFAGLEIKIINAISFTLQVSQQDVFGAFANDYVIHAGNNTSYPQPSNGYLYIGSGDAEAYTYVPFYVNGGFIFKFGKQKL